MDQLQQLEQQRQNVSSQLKANITEGLKQARGQVGAKAG
jgi:hypothetical protein